MCDECKQRSPGEVAEMDQAVADINKGVDDLVDKVSQYMDQGDDGPHAASSLAVSLLVTATPQQIATLLGFAVLRLTEQKRAEARP